MKKIFTRVANYIRRNPKTDIAVVATGLSVFLALTIGNISRASIWFDEAFSAYLVRFNYFEIAQFTATDVHPPLYYWVLKTWVLLFGTSEVAFRSLSILFGVTAIVAAYLLARRFFGRKAAAVSLLFLVISPMLVRYSDEARMYTMAATIVMAATYALSRAVNESGKKWWRIYAVLVSLGMWTHYFTALAWLAHVVWRFMVVERKGGMKKWIARALDARLIRSYLLAIALYIPWLPLFAWQAGVVQVGFWIGPIGLDTFTSYFANLFYYLESHQTTSWAAVAVVGIVLYITIMAPRVYRTLKTEEKKHYLLIMSLAWVSPLILLVLSLPPLSPLFVERYLVPAAIMSSVFIAVTLVIASRQRHPAFLFVPVVLVSVMMAWGVANVYTYGNFNKNSNTHIFTREVVQAAQAASPDGIPIVAQSPWVFYEAIFYNSDTHPIYFVDETTSYEYGSLDMLRTRDQFKIKDMTAFAEENPVIWYLANTTEADVPPLKESWVKLQTVEAYDELTGSTLYKATQYQIK